MAAGVERLDGDGATLAVLRRGGDGGGRAVLFLHGWPGTRADWLGVFGALAADPRWRGVELLAPDLRGYGASDKPAIAEGASEPYSAYAPAAHVGDLSALLDKLSLDSVIVAAFDLGANVAQALARASQSAGGLALWNPVHAAARVAAAKLDLAHETWYQQLHVQPWAPELIARERASVELYLRHFYTHWWGAGTVPEPHFQALVDAYAEPGAFAASIAWYRARAAARAGEVAAAAAAAPILQPAEVVWGDRDPLLPPALAAGLEHSFADVGVTHVPSAGHFGPLEAPRALADALERLANRLGWGDPPSPERETRYHSV